MTNWNITETPPTGHDPLDALIVRLATAYEEPRLLKFQLDDVGSATGRAAELDDRLYGWSTTVSALSR